MAFSSKWSQISNHNYMPLWIRFKILCAWSCNYQREIAFAYKMGWGKKLYAYEKAVLLFANYFKKEGIIYLLIYVIIYFSVLNAYQSAFKKFKEFEKCLALFAYSDAFWFFPPFPEANKNLQLQCSLNLGLGHKDGFDKFGGSSQLWPFFILILIWNCL